MKKVFRTLKNVVVTVLILTVICTFSGCKSSKPAKKESTLDKDHEKFRKEVFDKQ